MERSEVEVFKEIPGFTAILKAVIRNQIHMLVQQLSEQVGEEAVLLTCSMSDGSSGHLGSEMGKLFVEEHQQIMSQFLGYCLKRHHRKKSEESNNLQSLPEAVVSDTELDCSPTYQTAPFNQKRTHRVNRHSNATKRQTPYSEPPGRSNAASGHSDEIHGPNGMQGPIEKQGLNALGKSAEKAAGFGNEQSYDFNVFKLTKALQKSSHKFSNNVEQTVSNELESLGVNESLQPGAGVGPASAVKDNKTIVAGDSNSAKVKAEATRFTSGLDDVGSTCLETSVVTADNSQWEGNTTGLEESATEQNNQEYVDGKTANGKFRMVLVQKEEKKPRRPLTLEQRVFALKLMSSGLSSRKTALSLGVGKSQIQEIFKRRDEIMADWQSENVNPDRKRKARKTANDEINSMCLKWYNEAVASGYQVSGPALQQKALELAVQLGIPSFKASNGWLESFRKRYNLVTAGQVHKGNSGEKKNKDTTENKCTEKSVFDESVFLGGNSLNFDDSYIEKQVQRAINESDMETEAGETLKAACDENLESKKEDFEEEARDLQIKIENVQTLAAGSPVYSATVTSHSAFNLTDTYSCALKTSVKEVVLPNQNNLEMLATNACISLENTGSEQVMYSENVLEQAKQPQSKFENSNVTYQLNDSLDFTKTQGDSSHQTG